MFGTMNPLHTLNMILGNPSYQFMHKHNSVQRIVTFSANRNSNRFTEPTYLRIGIGTVCELLNMQIGIGIIFVR